MPDHSHTPNPTSLRAFVIVLRVVAGFAILTGLIDVVIGTAVLALMGANLAGSAMDPVLDSQFRFLSATWLGYGLALWWVTGDLAHRRAVLNILAIAMFVGGIGRLISIGVIGLPTAPILGFVAIELLGPIAAIAFSHRLVAPISAQ